MEDLYRTTPDGFRICPYNHQHVIIAVRFIGHLLKCSKSSGKAHQTCPWNAQHHIVEPYNYDFHYATCENQVHIDSFRHAWSRDELTSTEYQYTMPKQPRDCEPVWSSREDKAIEVKNFDDDSDSCFEDKEKESTPEYSQLGLIGRLKLQSEAHRNRSSLSASCTSELTVPSPRKPSPFELAGLYGDIKRVDEELAASSSSCTSEPPLPSPQTQSPPLRPTGRYGDIERVDEELAEIVDLFAASSFSKSGAGLAILKTLIETITKEANQ